MSLSVLLDYRLEDNKEHSFEVRLAAILHIEFTLHICSLLVCYASRMQVGNTLSYFSVQVSLFAELFNEMLQRDFGYRIYKALAALPAKDEKKEKEKKAKKEAEKKEAEKREIKKEKDEENEEPAVKKTKEDEDDRRKVSHYTCLVFSVCHFLNK